MNPSRPLVPERAIAFDERLIMALRVIFMGTPDFSVPTLSRIVADGHQVVAVYTRAPKPAGRRGLELRPSPIHVEAERLNLSVYTPKTLRTPEMSAQMASHGADVGVVVAYGLILPLPILNAPRLGCLNLHASLVPRWRGAAPIQRAIMAGDPQTGAMVMRMDEGLDTGPVALEDRIAIEDQMTAGDVHDVLAQRGADLMSRALIELEQGRLNFHPQSSQGLTYAHKIEKAECPINWAHPAQEVCNHIHGLSPFPGAYFEADFGKGLERMKVLRASVISQQGKSGDKIPGQVLDEALGIACGEGAIRLLDVQRAGKAPMQAVEFLRGTRVSPGLKLS